MYTILWCISYVILITMAVSYDCISKIYNILTYPWERRHRQWRKELIKDCAGTVCEIGVGTGLNIGFYPENIILYLIDLSKNMLDISQKKACNSTIDYHFIHGDIRDALLIEEQCIDVLVATFVCQLIPEKDLMDSFNNMVSWMKKDSVFKIVIPARSPNMIMALFQHLAQPINRFLYGVQLDTYVEDLILEHPDMKIDKRSFLNQSKTILLLEGRKIK